MPIYPSPGSKSEIRSEQEQTQPQLQHKKSKRSVARARDQTMYLQTGAAYLPMYNTIPTPGTAYSWDRKKVARKEERRELKRDIYVHVELT